MTLERVFARLCVAFGGRVRVVAHRQRLRQNGTCTKCNGRITEVIDDLYVEGQTPGVDEPYDSEVVRASCSPGCPGPDDVEL